MEGFLIVLLLVSALLNAMVLAFFIQWNKKQQAAAKSVGIIGSLEEFVEKMEKNNEELVWEMIEYTKVKENEFEQRLQVLEETYKPPLKEEGAMQEVAEIKEPLTPTKPTEGIEPLYKQGFSAKQIAKVLKMEYGEVELAVNMLNKKKSHQT